MPPSISSAFHTAAPAKVNSRNATRFMCARPAGSEIIVRRNGEKRRKNTTHWPWLRKNALRASRYRSQSSVSQRP